MKQLLPLLVAAALGASVAGCGGPTLESRAGDCWGVGAADCRQDLAPRLAALALGPSMAATVLEADQCGATIDCAVVPAPTVAADPTPGTVAALPTPRLPPEATAEATAEPEEVTPEVALATPATTTPEPVASRGDRCGGYDVTALEGKASLTPEETVCLQDTALGRRTAPDPEVQVAAVALYNQRVPGWPSAVEAALGKPSLANAPALNFAGIKPAYDRGRYSTVMKRAGTIWRNLDKGYQLTSSDRSFVCEFSCRSSAQLALSGKDPGDGITWCERWYDLAQRAGKPTDPIQDLIDQLE